ncbi:hypothetical protein, partial [Enterobacter mori]|uniref:hypothetical protein n=1 Tax=Enterobacter mori TaxID=539813 RepID=UPI003D6F239C
RETWLIKRRFYSYIYELLMFNLAKGNSYKQRLNGSSFLMTAKGLLDGCEIEEKICYCLRIK